MGRPLLFVLLFAVIAGVTTAAQAQLWIGPAALEVRAEDGGKPAAGGEVRLEYLDVDPPEGPEPVRLDSKGRAVIGSLAEGRWRLEVSRPGAMTYRAEIEVQRDSKPHLIDAVQHNVPGAVTMMKVNLARAKGSAVPPPPREIAAKPRRPEPQPEIPAPVPPVEEVVPVAETPVPVPKPETPAPAPPAPPQQVPASAAEPLRPPPSLAPPPTPKPEPKKETPPPAPAPPIPQPTPEAERPAPAPVPTAPPVKPAPAPQPEPKKETPPPVQPPAPAPQRPIPAPVPERPAPPPAPVTPPTPAPPPTTRQGSHQDRTCAECKPGESSLSVEVVARPVAAGASGCGEGLREALMRRDGGAGLPAGCQMLRLELPPNARYIGYRYEVQDGGASADCLAGKDCPAGNARWPMDPLLFRDGTGKTTVSTAFENRSPDRERRAVLTIYFKEAGNPNAPRPMLPSRPRQPGRPPG